MIINKRLISSSAALSLMVFTTYSFGVSNHSVTKQLNSVELSKTNPSYNRLLTLSLGADIINKTNAQRLTLLPPFQNYYTSNGSRQTAVDAGLFFGFERTINKTMFAQLGIAGYWDSQIKRQGDVWLFALPVFDDLTYSYKINHSRVMLAGKLLTSLSNQAIHPYLSGELGVGFNRATNYHEHSFTVGVPPMAPFSNHSQSSFVYSIGLGIDYSVNQQVRLGIGYQFSDLGSASLGVTPAETTSQTLNVSHLYTNQIRLQLTTLI